MEHTCAMEIFNTMNGTEYEQVMLLMTTVTMEIQELPMRRDRRMQLCYSVSNFCLSTLLSCSTRSDNILQTTLRPPTYKAQLAIALRFLIGSKSKHRVSNDNRATYFLLSAIQFCYLHLLDHNKWYTPPSIGGKAYEEIASTFLSQV